MRWFGESWGAPINEDVEHAVTPVGKPCLRCGIDIEIHDQGLLVPLVGVTSVTDEPWHIQCWMDELGIQSQ